MLEFIKKFLRNKEESKVEEIFFPEIEKWIDEKSKPFFDEAGHEIRCTLDSFNEKKSRINEDLNNLGSLQLQNPNIPIKAKQFMEGNREFYMSALRKWINGLNFDNSNRADFSSLKKNAESFEVSLDSLNKETVRSYTILQEFFGNEISHIAVGIRGMSDDAKAVLSILNNEKMNKFEVLRNRMNDIKEKIAQKNKILLMKNEEISKLEAAKKEKDELLKKAEELKQSGDYAKYRELKSEKENAVTELKNYEDALIQSFSSIERALRKYSHIAFEHESLVLDYVASPLKTLSDDKNFVIGDILSKMKELIESNTLKLDDAKKSKTLEEIKKLDKETLAKYVNFYNKFSSRMRDIENSLSSMEINNKIKDMNAAISNIEIVIKNINREVERIDSVISKLDIDSLVKSLEREMMGVEGKAISIKF